VTYLYGKEQFLMEGRKPVSFLGSVLGEPHFGLRVRLQYLDRLLKPLPGVHSILDVGCARGQTAFYLASRFPQAMIHGVDINPDLVNYCNQLALKANLSRRVQFSVMDVSSLCLPSAYDLITCMDVIEHIPNWQAAIRNMIDGLNPEGDLIIHTLHRSKYLDKNFGFRKLQHTDDKVISGTLGSTHVHEHGFFAEDFNAIPTGSAMLEKQYTFGPFTMFLHTIFEAYRGRPRYYHFFLTPFLAQMARLELGHDLKDGGGILIHVRNS
jgi:SAM-dependent methyltransferase